MWAARLLVLLGVWRVRWFRLLLLLLLLLVPGNLLRHPCTGWGRCIRCV
jgi:hypothetical protein